MYVMAAVMLCVMLPGMAATAKAETAKVVESGKAGDNITFRIFEYPNEPGVYHLEFTGSGDMYDYEDEKDTIWKTDYAESIRSVGFGKGITHIGDYTLDGILKIEKIEMSTGLLSLGVSALHAFKGPKIAIPSTVKEIGLGAIYWYSGEEITYPESLEFVGWANAQSAKVKRYPLSREQWAANVSFEHDSDGRVYYYDESFQWGTADQDYKNRTDYVPWTEASAADPSPVTPPSSTNRIVSDWARDEIARADEKGLIPAVLQNADLTQKINRAEFASVAVKTYESLSPTPAIPAVINPFTDTNDVDTLKAYSINVINGTSATTFTPDRLLYREECATMLTRVFKKVTIPGWSIADDALFPLRFTRPAPFADDAEISAYAKESVYFMVANGIIKGMGNNLFGPRATSTTREAIDFATATREQALVIALRMVENYPATGNSKPQ